MECFCVEHTEIVLDQKTAEVVLGAAQSSNIEFDRARAVFVGEVAPVPLSDQVTRVTLRNVTDWKLLRYLIDCIRISPKVDLVYMPAHGFKQDDWNRIRDITHCISSLTFEHPNFGDSACTMWEDLAESEILDFHLDHPEFEENTFANFLRYIMKAKKLCSVRLTGRIQRRMSLMRCRSPEPFEVFEYTSRFVSSITQSKSIKWLSFPWTYCFVGETVAKAMPHLRLELLDIGLTPPAWYERIPGDDLMAGLRENSTIGIFRDEERKKIADKLGIAGLSVRAVGVVENDSEYLCLHPEQKMGIFSVLTHDQMDQANAICRERMDNYTLENRNHTTICWI